MSIEKVKGYGELAHLKLTAEKKAVLSTMNMTRNRHNFALWKFEEKECHGQHHLARQARLAYRMFRYGHERTRRNYLISIPAQLI